MNNSTNMSSSQRARRSSFGCVVAGVILVLQPLLVSAVVHEPKTTTAQAATPDNIKTGAAPRKSTPPPPPPPPQQPPMPPSPQPTLAADEEMWDDFTDARGGVGCTSRCRMHEAAINMTKEAIKQQILSKLGLSRAPNMTGKVLPKIPTLTHLLEVYGMQSDQAQFEPGPVFEESEDDYHAKTQLIMTMAKEPPRLWRFPPELNVQYFSLTSSGAASIERVVRASLWLYVKPPKVMDDKPINVIVHHVMMTSEGSGPILSHFRTKSVFVDGRGKWVDVDLDKLVVDWIHNPNRNLGVVIQAFDRKGRNIVNTDRNVANGTLMPFIEIHTTEEKKKRRKRMIGLNCEENSNEVRCCRYPLTVDFEEFGWDWIIAPKKYEANYCSGECPFVFLQKYPHTHLVQQANPSGSAGPCCAPRKMSSISMLYFDDNNNIIYGLLPGMVVDRCGCS